MAAKKKAFKLFGERAIDKGKAEKSESPKVKKAEKKKGYK